MFNTEFDIFWVNPLISSVGITNSGNFRVTIYGYKKAIILLSQNYGLSLLKYKWLTQKRKCMESEHTKETNGNSHFNRHFFVNGSKIFKGKFAIRVPVFTNCFINNELKRLTFLVSLHMHRAVKRPFKAYLSIFCWLLLLWHVRMVLRNQLNTWQSSFCS